MENQRRTVNLELELEKARQRVEDNRKYMTAQCQKLLEERKQLQKERDDLEEEKKRALNTGTAGLALHAALQQEEERQKRAHVLLQDVEQQLMERQDAFCSLLLPRAQRMEMENDLLLRVAKDPAGAELGLVDGIRDIFKNDRHCAGMTNMDKRKNGQLMWLYLKYWRLQVTLQKYRRVEERLKGSLPHVK